MNELTHSYWLPLLTFYYKRLIYSSYNLNTNLFQCCSDKVTSDLVTLCSLSHILPCASQNKYLQMEYWGQILQLWAHSQTKVFIKINSIMHCTTIHIEGTLSYKRCLYFSGSQLKKSVLCFHPLKWIVYMHICIKSLHMY